jgi:hypothetical protein
MERQEAAELVLAFKRLCVQKDEKKISRILAHSVSLSRLAERFCHYGHLERPSVQCMAKVRRNLLNRTLIQYLDFLASQQTIL